jgi:mannose-6-phosphate isomerase-like protein (cupin superfamily)
VDEPVLLSPGEGERISERLRIKAARPEVVVTESNYEPGGRGPKPHVHHHHVDAFWILEGRLAFALGPDGDEVEAGAGSFALVPPDVVHTFRNPGPEPARFLNFHAPGMGFDAYLRSGYEIPYDQHDPPADGGRSPSEVILVPPGGGERVAVGPGEAFIKAGAEDAIGSLAVVEVVVGPGGSGPVLHHHRETTESFYVLDGTFTLHLGGREVDLSAGTYGFVPPGNNHTSSNPRRESARVLNVIAPGGIDQLLKDVAAAAAESGSPPDPQLVAQLASKYDFVPA